MATYHIEPERATLHGKFSRELAPALTIQSGDTVTYRTLDAAWNIEPPNSPMSESRPRKFPEFDSARDAGHALCGPIAIEGAMPNMTLEVQIGEVRPGGWGWTSSGGWQHEVHKRLGTTEKEVMHYWQLDAERKTGTNQYGHVIALRPFMGVMGMPPDEPGLHSTAPPRVTGGNLDCKELIPGSRLFLPIAVEGGLFSTGDGHAVQGDGEVCVTAIECPMERVELTFVLHPNMHIATPRARIAEGWITLGLHEDLNEAMFRALEEMLVLMDEQYGLSRDDALALASLVVNLRITQIVNGVKGVHALLPTSAIRQLA